MKVAVENMKLESCFVTGTDTDAGKTIASAALLRFAAKQGLDVAGVKPIASGFTSTSAGWINADIEALKQASNVRLSDDLVNTYAFTPAIAPHIAAQEAGVELCLNTLAGKVELSQNEVDFLVVEGVGGWRVPLLNKVQDNDSVIGRGDVSSLAKRLNLPVVLVVGMRLGCINHAIMTAKAIVDDGLELKGWIANSVDENFERSGSNLATLKRLLPAPLLFEIPYLESADDLHSYVPAFLDW